MKEKALRKIVFHFWAPLVVAALAIPGCASLQGAKHTAAVSATAAHETFKAVYKTEKALRCSEPTAPRDHCISAAKDRELLDVLELAAKYDIKINELIDSTPGGEPTSGDALVFAYKLWELIRLVMADIPRFSQTEALHAKFEK